MKLYFAPRSRAVRTAWLLFELGIEFDIEKYELGAKEMRTPEFRSVNPNARVPVLDDGDVRMTESAAIAQYLLARYDTEGKFSPAVLSPEFPIYLQWLHYGEGMIMGAMNNFVVETVFLPPEKSSQVHADRAFKLMDRYLRAVDAHLADREYLAGAFSAADTITGHACYMSEWFGVTFDEMPNLRAYLDRIKGRPAFQKALEL